MLHYDNFKSWPEGMKLKELHTVARFVTLNGVSKEDMQELVKFGNELAQENKTLRKVIARACRMLAEGGFGIEVGCNETCTVETIPHCATCMMKTLIKRAENEHVCRVCGCTQGDACPGGCSWVEEDLCSACAQKPDDGASAEEGI